MFTLKLLGKTFLALVEREKAFSKHLVSLNGDQAKCEYLIFLEQQISKFQLSPEIVTAYCKVRVL